MNRIRSVLVVDDDPLFLPLLAKSIRDQDSLYLTQQLTNVEDAISWLKTHAVDIVISDIIFPDKSGYRLLQEARSLLPDSIIVAITSYPTMDSAIQCLSLGANGFFDKAQDLKQIASYVAISSPSVATIQASIADEIVSAIPSALLSHDSISHRDVVSARDLRLSSTNTKILSLVCDGKSNREIAQTLKLSESTVKRKVSELLSQTQYASRTEMAVKTLKNLLLKQ